MLYLGNEAAKESCHLFQSSDLENVHLKICGRLFPNEAVLHLAERWYLDGALLIVAQCILLEHQGNYQLLLSFPKSKKRTNNIAAQNPMPHIDFQSVIFNFPSNMWIFQSPNSCIKLVKFSRYMEGCLICKANTIKEVIFFFNSLQVCNSNFFLLRFVIYLNCLQKLNFIWIKPQIFINCMLKSLVRMTCNFMLAQLSTNLQTVLSTQFHSSGSAQPMM